MNRKLLGQIILIICAGLCARVDSTVTGWEGAYKRGMDVLLATEVNTHPTEVYTRWEEDAGNLPRSGWLIRVMNSRFMTQARHHPDTRAG